MSFSITRLIKNTLAVGPRHAWRQIMSLGEVKAGRLVGKDERGNEYYENKNELWVRERWVVPAHKDYDPSEIPAEWHIWLHKIEDRPPAEQPIKKKKWQLPHTPNMTGDPSKAFKTYNTNEPKMEAWTPKVAERGS